MSAKYKLLESYVLLEKLASGGMADIYLGKKNNYELQKFVSIKKVLPPYMSKGDFEELFKNEIKVSISLHHSNIVSYLDYIILKDQTFLVMEYINGVNLRQLINDLNNFKRKLDIPSILFIISEIASGLDYAHRKTDDVTGEELNIVHRDINPTNLMISFEGEVKIIDFGIARSSQKIDKTKAGFVIGKMSYLSPEQVQENPIDGRSDIFSLATVMWELFTGKKLFLGESDFATLNAIVYSEIPKVSEIEKGIPKEIDILLEKALHRDINKRIQSMSEFKYEIERVLFAHYPEFRKSHFVEFVKDFYRSAIDERREKLTKYRKAKFEKNKKEGPPPAPIVNPTGNPPESSLSKKLNRLNFLHFSPVNRYESTRSGYLKDESSTSPAGDLPEGFEQDKNQDQSAPRFHELKNRPIFSQPVSTYTRPKASHFNVDKKLSDTDQADDKSLFHLVPYWLRPSNYYHLTMMIITIYAGYSFLQKQNVELKSEDKVKTLLESNQQDPIKPNADIENPISTVENSARDRLNWIDSNLTENPVKPTVPVKVKPVAIQNVVQAKANRKPARIEFGHLNLFIDKFDTNSMKLFVDGREVTGRSPFLNLKVAANRKVSIFLSLKKSNKSVVKTLKLEPNGTQFLKINAQEELLSPSRKVSSDKK